MVQVTVQGGTECTRIAPSTGPHTPAPSEGTTPEPSTSSAPSRDLAGEWQKCDGRWGRGQEEESMLKLGTEKDALTA